MLLGGNAIGTDAWCRSSITSTKRLVPAATCFQLETNVIENVFCSLAVRR